MTRFPIDGTGRLASEREHPTAVLIGPVVSAYTAGQLSAGGIDVWGSQSNPGSVTDWGPIINALIVAGHRRLYFAEQDFPFSTQLLMAPSTIFEGASGLVVWPSNYPKTRLLWTGTGSGNAIGWNDGCVMRDLGVFYTQGTFTGSIHDGNAAGIGGEANMCVLERCTFGSILLHSAHAIALMNNVARFTFRDCAMGGAQWGVRGYEDATSNNSSSVTIQGGYMFGCVNALIGNIGWGWLIDNVRFELFPTPAGGNNPKIIDSDLSLGGGSGAKFTMRDCIIEDATGGGNAPYIHQRSWEPWQCLITGMLFTDTLPGPLFQFDGAGEIRIENNYDLSVASGAVIDLGTAAKNLIRIVGNFWQTAQAAGNPDILNVSTQAANFANMLIENNREPMMGLTGVTGGNVNAPVIRSVVPRDRSQTVSASSGTVTIPDPSLTAITLTNIDLGGDITIAFPANTGLGQRFRIALTQDGTGGHAVTWPSVFWAGGSAPTLSGANKTDVFEFQAVHYDNDWAGFVVGLNCFV